MSIAAFRGQPLVDNQRGLDIQEAQLRVNQGVQQSEKYNKVLTEAASTIDGIVVAARDNGLDPKGQEVQKAIAPILKVATDTAAKASEAAGIDYSSMLLSRVEKSLSIPTKQQLVEQEAQEKLNEEQAKADAALAIAPQTEELARQEAERKQQLNKEFGEYKQIGIMKAGSSKVQTGYRGPDGILYHDKEGKIPAEGFIEGGTPNINKNENVNTTIEPGHLEPGTKASNDADVAIINSDATLHTIQAIKAGWRPEFNTVATKWKAWGLDKLERFNIDALNDEDRKLVTEFNAWMSNSTRLLNDRIKALSGAATSVQEADRIIEEMGKAALDGPTKYMAKIDATLASVEAARARAFYYRMKGIPPKFKPDNMSFAEAREAGMDYPFPVYGDAGSVSVEDFMANTAAQEEITQKGTERAQELLKSGLSVDQVRSQMTKEGWPE